MLHCPPVVREKCLYPGENEISLPTKQIDIDAFCPGNAPAILLMFLFGSFCFNWLIFSGYCSWGGICREGSRGKGRAAHSCIWGGNVQLESLKLVY